MKRWRWMVVFVVLVSACGGGASDSKVESEDGRATLSLQPGSLPEGVSPDNVQLEVIVDETAEPGAPVVAVQLLPDGLVLSEPATLTIALPEALEGGFMAIHMWGDSIEFLDGDIIQDDDGVFAFQTSVGHFSWVFFFPEVFFEVSLSVDPEHVLVGQTQRATATITAKTEPISLWLQFRSDPPDTVRLFQFSAPQPPISFKRTKISWDWMFWDFDVPPDPPLEITATPTGWETSLVFATCKKDNVDDADGPWFGSSMIFDVTLLSRGEPVLRDSVRFPRKPVGDPDRFFVPPGDVELLDLSPGDRFKAIVGLAAQVKSLCTESSTTTMATAMTTSTTTTSAAPTVCEVAALEDHSLTFTSADVGESIPPMFQKENAYDNEFPTPAFKWSGVPAETTEIAILIQRISTDRDRDSVANGTLWDDVPISNIRWIVSGIDPTTSGLARSSLSDPLPDGVIEHDNWGPTVTPYGEPLSNKFVGASFSHADFLFTMFALCDPATGARDAYSPGWLSQHAIAIAWFTSSME